MKVAGRARTYAKIAARRARALLWVAGLVGSAAATPARAADAAFELSAVAPGVYVHTGTVAEWGPANDGDVANLGLIVGERCAAVVDTGGSPAVGQRFRAAIAAVTTLPVCFVINTHEHQDHVLGDAVFRDGRPAPEFVASAKFAAALSARQAFFRHAMSRDFHIDLPADDIVYPSRSVDGTLDLDLGGRVITLRSWPTAHTDNDLTVYDSRTRTLFAGDLWFDQHLPVVDGSLRGWLSVIEQLATIPAAIAVPGHGRASMRWPQAITPEVTYLRSLRDGVRGAIKAGLTISKTVDAVKLEPSAGWSLGEEFHQRNVTAAYAELEWED